MTWLMPILGLLTLCVARPNELDLSTLGNRIEDLAIQAESVRRGAPPPTLLPPEKHEQLYEDALLYWMLDEHEPAALRLWLLRSVLDRDHPIRHSVDELLSDSLTKLDARVLAQRVIDEVLAEDQHPYVTEAATRKLLLTARHDAWAVGDVYDGLRDRGLLENAPPGLAYAIGRARWASGDPLGAEAAFRSVPEGHDSYVRARYHLGVIRTQFREFPEAEIVFTSLLHASDPSVAALSRLALARIHYELGEWSFAARLYRSIPDASPHRVQALEELAWTEIRQGFPDVAADVIDQLVKDYPHHPSVGRMLVVLGRVSMRQGQWTAAERAFTSALDHLDSHPPEAGDLGAGQRATRARQGLTHVDDAIAEAFDDADVLAMTMEHAPSQNRQLELQRSAHRLLGSIVSQRTRLLELDVALLTGPARRTAAQTLDDVRALPDLVMPTLEEADTRIRALSALRRQVFSQRDPEESARHTRLDGFHQRLDDAENHARSVLDLVDREIRLRTTPIDNALVAQEEALTRLAEDRARLTPALERLEALAGSFERSERERMLELQRSVAAAGIVDASWLRLEQARDAQADAIEAQGTALGELETTFRRMRARLDMEARPSASPAR